MTMCKEARLKISARLDHLEIVSDKIAACLTLVDNLSQREETVYSVQLAVHELCCNIIEHGYDGANGSITLFMHVHDCEPRRITITTLDKAPKTFDEDGWQPPDLAIPAEGGLGVWLIRELMDEVNYRPASGNNRWQLVKYLA